VSDDFTEQRKIERHYTVVLDNGERRHVTANRFLRSGKNDKRVTFEGDRRSAYATVASFENVTDVFDDAAVHPVRVWPSPVKDVEYYSLEDMRQALKDLNYSYTDDIVAKVRQRLSVRNDGRYSLTELQEAARQIDNISGSWHAERFRDAALQARKNRVFKAHNGS
jgi:glycogen debranching enzyme